MSQVLGSIEPVLGHDCSPAQGATRRDLRETSLYCGDGSFNLRTWRALLSALAANAGAPACQVICPFGFEVSRNPDYLKKDLLNFFIYLGVDNFDEEDQRSIVTSFASSLLLVTKRDYSEFNRDIRQIITPFGRIQLAPRGQKSIYIKCRRVTSKLIEEYAQYMLAAIGGVVNRQIKAIVEFERDPLSRRYLFQLGIMWSHIFAADHFALAGDHAEILMEHVRTLLRAEYLGADRNDSYPSLEEHQILNSIIMPYVQDLYRYVCPPGESDDQIVDLSILDYHGQNYLKASVSRGLLMEKTRFIVESYEFFGQ